MKFGIANYGSLLQRDLDFGNKTVNIMQEVIKKELRDIVKFTALQFGKTLNDLQADNIVDAYDQIENNGNL